MILLENIKKIFGKEINIDGVPYKSYRRPYQQLDRNIEGSKLFLPGMGIYIINENSVTSSYPNTNQYNKSSSDTRTSTVNLKYSEYSYSANFIGFVLDTSINNIDEYNRNYRLNSDSFSKISSQIQSF